VAAELSEVAEHAEAAASGQQQIARRARAMERQRARGWSWAKILDREALPGIFDLARRSAKHMAEATRALAQVVASGLSAEGESRRQIGRRLGVTHQRVTALLRGQRSSTASNGG
jgi:hypothetical protein